MLFWARVQRPFGMPVLAVESGPSCLLPIPCLRFWTRWLVLTQLIPQLASRYRVHEWSTRFPMLDYSVRPQLRERSAELELDLRFLSTGNVPAIIP